MIKVVSATVELVAGGTALELPARVIQLLRLRADDRAEARLSQEGRTFESTISVGAAGHVHGREAIAEMAGPVFLGHAAEGHRAVLGQRLALRPPWALVQSCR